MNAYFQVPKELKDKTEKDGIYIIITDKVYGKNQKMQKLLEGKKSATAFVKFNKKSTLKINFYNVKHISNTSNVSYTLLRESVEIINTESAMVRLT